MPLELIAVGTQKSETRFGNCALPTLGVSARRGRAGWDVDGYLARVCEVLGTELDAISSRHKDEPAPRLRELVVVVGVDVYGVKVRACAERLGMNAGSVSRALAQASARERDNWAFHEQQLDLEGRLATLEAGSQTTNKARR